MPSRAKTVPQDQTMPNSDFGQGDILWLDYERVVNASQKSRGVERSPAYCVTTNKLGNAHMYNHPILIVSRPASDPVNVYFVVITSFRGRPNPLENLSRCSRGAPKYRQQRSFVPIAPALGHPLHAYRTDLTYDRLRLAGGTELDKDSYTNITEVYRMDVRDVRPYRSQDPKKLDSESLQRLLGMVAREANFWAGRQWQGKPPSSESSSASSTSPKTPPKPPPSKTKKAKRPQFDVRISSVQYHRTLLPHHSLSCYDSHNYGLVGNDVLNEVNEKEKKWPGKVKMLEGLEEEDEEEEEEAYEEEKESARAAARTAVKGFFKDALRRLKGGLKCRLRRLGRFA